MGRCARESRARTYWVMCLSLAMLSNAVVAGVASVGAQTIPDLPIAPLPPSPLPSAGPRDTIVPPTVLVLPWDRTLGDSVPAIVTRDFTFSDQLNVIVLDAESYDQLGSMDDDSLFAEGTQFGVEYIVRIMRTEGGARVTLLDVPGQRLLRASNFHLGWDSLGVAPRMDVHRLADIVQEWITGTRGIAATRIAYVAEGAIHLVDSDGTGDTVVTDKGTSLSPSWHPQGNALVYADLADAGTQIVRLDLDKGKAQTFSATKRGFNITPVFTPRGDSVVYATAGGEGSHLVISSASGKGKARVLRMQFAEEMHDIAAPIFSGDGKRIAFVASRPSYPQIYTMDLRGTNVKRLVPATKTLRNERTAPDWSPDGKTILYQQQNRKFQIWAAHLKNGVADTVTRVTNQGENEDPSWAPDNRHFVLTSNRGGDKQLWILDLLTDRWRQLTITPGARLSSWSPRLARRPVSGTR